MTTDLAKVEAVEVVVRQADNDETLLGLWLHGRSDATRRAYEADARRFLVHVGKALASITLGDLQAYADVLAASDASMATQARALSSVKSLFAFAHRLGYLAFDVARVLKLPKLKNTLSERILSELQVHAIIAHEKDKRNKLMLRVLYGSGIRVSELCTLCWRDAQDRGNGEGQITVFGKGGKTRAIVLPASLWKDLLEFRSDAAPETPIFKSRKGGKALDQSQVNRIVHAAAERADVDLSVSPHWFRHAHASHAIDGGAPINLVQATLGHASTATTGRYLHARPNESSARFLAV